MSKSVRTLLITHHSSLITHHFPMANEELIYRITRAVYGRLGEDADERAVEALVTDIYRAIEPVVGEEGVARSRGPAGGSEGRADRLIVSVFGVDHPGIVAAVSPML